jgi:signal transduction histidine kinase/DNA-binding response OmpR family regulator/streptogramin lyase
MIIAGKNRKIYLAFLLLVSVFAANLFSQSLSFNNFAVKDGLSNNKVNTILQDINGFIWLGTEDGLNRFDGYRFKIYRNNPLDSNSISDNYIWSLFEDEDGNLWIGTKSGELNLYDLKSDSFRHWKIETRSIKESGIIAILKDSNGNVWIGTYQSGLYRLNPETNELINWNYNPEDLKSLSNNFVTSIIEDDGYLWISTYNGLNKYNLKSNDNTFRRFYSDPQNKNSLSNNLIWEISKSEFDPDVLWIGTANGLVRYNKSKNSFTRIDLPENNNLQFANSISSIVEEKINNETVLWLGTYSGLARLNLNSGRSVRFLKNETDPSSLVSNEINQIIKDKSGVIWMATENGLSNISKKATKFNNLFSEQRGVAELEELKKKNVKAIDQHDDGSIFFGTSNGIYYLNGNSSDRKLRRFSSTEGLNVWSIVSGSSDYLWIGTYGQGLKQLNLKNGRVKNINIKSPTFETSAYNYIKSLHLEENILWLGFWGGGFSRYDTETGNYKIWITESSNPNSISYNDLWSIIRDSKGRLWLGTNGGGLNLFDESDGGKFHRLNDDSNHSIKLSSNSIYSLLEGRRGKFSNNKEHTILWVGTSSGLNKLVINSSADIFKVDTSNTIVISYSTENGLSDNSIKSILEDENGNLWLATNAGISFFDVEKENFTNFSASDGLKGNDFNSESALYSNDDLMYFGSTEGLNVFDPEQITRSDFIPALVFTDFQIFNQPVKIGGDSPLKKNILEAEEIIIPFSQNVFSFEFAALDYNSPQSIQYSYMMEGFDDDWVSAGNRRFITYTNLNSGSYIFKVKATNSDGVWSDNYKSISVIINPPWWRTSWAYVIYVFLIIGGLYTARRIEMNRSRLRNELKMREYEAKKRAELENLKSRFFANLSHEFRTPLTLIRGPIEELINKKAGDNQEEYLNLIKRNSEKLQELIDQLLELTQLENASIPLKAKQENLVKILRGMFYSFDSLAKQKNINLSFICVDDSIISWVDRDKLEKIINNLLSNAFKFTPDDGSISLSVTRQIKDEKEFAEVKIADTGIGIPADKIKNIFDRFYQVDDSTRKKYGGSGIGLALVKELVDLHRWNIEVKSDLGKGTEFILSIPISDTYLSEREKVLGQIVDSEKETETNWRPTEEDSEPIEIEIEKEIEQEIIEKKKLLGDKPSILIVEDSEDVRLYLKSLLKGTYNIHEAVDGEDGIKKSSEVMPDLIISDVMMPSMNGIEFCRKIKTDWQTSHIPVILLTAKASPESKIEGLETGADDYLTKPFSSKELLIRIKNLLEQRKTLRERFSKEIKIETSAIAVTSLDNEFLQKAFDVAEKNLSNTEFNSETFAKEMFLSRSQLHRKLLAVTGQAPGEFIRTYRLKKAASLILENKLNVTQIAFEVGFSSPSHFSKAFKQQFNCLPKEFSGQV